MNVIAEKYVHRFFIARVAAVFVVAALMLFFGHVAARAQDVAGDEDEFVSDEESFGDGEVSDEEIPAEEESVTKDEGGFFGAVGDFFGGIKDTAVGAYDAATDFLGFGEEEEAEPPAEETEAPIAPLPVTAPTPKDVDVTAPASAPKSNPFALRVQIAATDVAAMLRSARGPEPIRYEPQGFDIPERGRLMLRAEQDGPLFCLVFDISEFRAAAALETASFEVNGARGAAEKGEVNTACVGLPSLSATAPLVVEAVFK